MAWTKEMINDLYAFHSINAEEELIKILNEELKKEAEKMKTSIISPKITFEEFYDENY